MTVRVVAGLLMLAAAPRAAAQLPGLLPAGSYVKDIWYPKLFWTPREGLNAGGYFAVLAPMRYATYDDPQPYVAAVSLDGQAATSGSRFLRLDAFAPALADGWRFRVTLATERWNRTNYFGLGNASTFDETNQTGGRELFYRARHRRDYARLEIQRRVIGGLRVLAGAHAERWSLDTVQTPSQLADDLGAAVPATVTDLSGDVSARFGLVFDTRDHEPAPRRGVLLEAIHTVGEARDAFYARTTVSARGYVTLSERVSFTARVAGRRMGGTPPLGALYLFEASDEPFTVLGSGESHRAIPDNRYLGDHVLFGNLDVHYTVFEIPTLVRAILVGYVDAGRVFHDESFRLTTDDLHVGGGSGFVLHLFRNAIVGVTAGVGPDGMVVHALTAWPY